MKTLWASLTVLSLCACTAASTSTHNKAFDLPEALYSVHGDDDPNLENLHPAGYLGRLNTMPKTNCDKEALRKLVIALNMYSYDQMNQSYYLETKEPGAQILLETFPEFKDLTGEGGRVINIEKMSNHLRTISFPCD